ncbi:MAG: hypothetical protein DMG28_00605 [Acidobacteria bacterium]|nr:MAG: hypothetical protein DMG29_15395 [Acidobacteriota bacterium]PYU36474.1 MAG: hypothetical protein DMG28_00605 [Acidobacteriota bacterium]
MELSFAVLEHRPSTGDADCGLGLDSQKVHAEYTIKKNIQIVLNRHPACGKLPPSESDLQVLPKPLEAVENR